MLFNYYKDFKGECLFFSFVKWSSESKKDSLWSLSQKWILQGSCSHHGSAVCSIKPSCSKPCKSFSNFFMCHISQGSKGKQTRLSPAMCQTKFRSGRAPRKDWIHPSLLQIIAAAGNLTDLVKGYGCIASEHPEKREGKCNLPHLSPLFPPSIPSP